MVVKSFGLDLVGEFDLDANQALDQPADFEAMLDFGSEGSAKIVGKMGLDGALDAVINLTYFELAPYAALAGQEMDVSGRASGRVEICDDSGCRIGSARNRFEDRERTLCGCGACAGRHARFGTRPRRARAGGSRSV